MRSTTGSVCCCAAGAAPCVTRSLHRRVPFHQPADDTWPPPRHMVVRRLNAQHGYLWMYKCVLLPLGLSSSSLDTLSDRGELVRRGLGPTLARGFIVNATTLGVYSNVSRLIYDWW